MGPFLAFLFGCLHRNQTRPFTLNKFCYTVCLDCGRELPYSWASMRTLRAAECTGDHAPSRKEIRAAA